jgi:hypothetical protein
VSLFAGKGHTAVSVLELRGTKLGCENYLDPKGCWGDPSGNIHRMSGELEIIATISQGCAEAERKALCSLAAPKQEKRTLDKPNGRK